MFVRLDSFGRLHMIDEKLAYTYREAAAHLTVSPRTIRQWVKDGRLEAIRLGRLVRIPRTALQALLGDVEEKPPQQEAASERIDEPPLGLG